MKVVIAPEDTAPHGAETAGSSASFAGVGDNSDPEGGYGHIAGSECLHTSTVPTNRGRKRFSPGTIPPRTVWKPPLGVHHWLELVKPSDPTQWGQEASAKFVDQYLYMLTRPFVVRDFFLGYRDSSVFKLDFAPESEEIEPALLGLNLTTLGEVSRTVFRFSRVAVERIMNYSCAAHFSVV